MSSHVARHVFIWNELVRSLLEPLPYVFCRVHKGFYNMGGKLLLADEVHVNCLGHYHLYRSYCGATLKALSFLSPSCYQPQFLSFLGP